MNKIIAIDGPAASGKGTLARRLATALCYAYLDTGSLYRATAFEVLEAGGAPEDAGDALAGAQVLQAKLQLAASPDLILHNAGPEERFGAEIEIEAETEAETSQISNTSSAHPRPAPPHSKLCKKQSVSDILSNPAFREERVGDAASKVAVIPAVREALVTLQRDFAKEPGQCGGAPYKGAILDGRDIGSVVCPNADVKLYITASNEVRAQRRTKELQSKGLDVMYEAVLRDMRVRDERDSKRQAAPLTRAKDAIVLDTSDLSPDEALEKALEIVRGRI